MTISTGGTLVDKAMQQMDGQAIADLQRALNTLGFFCPINGLWDNASQAALADFQANNLLEASGLPDTATRAAIERLRQAWQGKDLLV